MPNYADDAIFPICFDRLFQDIRPDEGPKLKKHFERHVRVTRDFCDSSTMGAFNFALKEPDVVT